MDYYHNSKMAEEYDAIEVLLPDTKIVNTFLKLSENDKLKVLELGVSMLQNGQKRYNTLCDKSWGEKLEKLTKESALEIQKITTDYENLQCEIRETKKNHLKKIKELNSTIRTETTALFENEIKSLKLQRDELIERANTFNERLLNIEKTNNAKFMEEMNTMRSYYENREEKIRNEFKELMDKHSELVDKKTNEIQKAQQNSTIKGQTGEDWVYHELLKQCNTAEIIPTFKEKEKGDFVLRESNFVGMLEAKNYKKNVPKKEIEKFYRDMEKNSEYNYGILASLNHGVVRRPDFTCEFRHGCPIIFLHKVRENPEKLSLAIKFCKLIEKNKSCIDITNEETMIKIQNLIKPIKTEYNQMKQLLDKFRDNMNKSMETQFTNMISILDLLNIE